MASKMMVVLVLMEFQLFSFKLKPGDVIKVGDQKASELLDVGLVDDARAAVSYALMFTKVIDLSGVKIDGVPPHDLIAPDSIKDAVENAGDAG